MRKSKKGIAVLITANFKKNKAMLAAKVDPIVACKTIDNVLFVSDFPEGNIPGVSFFTTPNILRRFRLGGPIWRLCFIPLLCVRRNIQVIIGMFTFPHGIIAYLCARLTRRRSVICLMGGAPEVYFRCKLYEKLILFFLKRSDIVTINGESGRNYLLKKGLKEDRTFVLSCVLNTNRFKPLNLEKEYDIIFMGRLVPVKRIDILLKAIYEVHKYHKNIKVAIVGDGPLKNELKQLAKILNIHNNISFLGWQENTEYYYNKSKIFILTSEEEGLSLAMMEAMSCGLPAIVPDVGDMTSLASNGYNSLVIKPLNINAFADAIRLLLNDKILYDTLSKGAIKSIMENKTIEHGARIWDEIFKRILALD